METETLLQKERKTVNNIDLSSEELKELKKDRPKILALIIEGVNRRNGAQHPLSPKTRP